MAKISNRHGQIIFIEGVWGSGKTTLIKVLKKTYGSSVKLLKEPNHLFFCKNGSPKKITDWYMEAHYKNIYKAARLAKNNDIVLIERSPLSSIAFMKAYLNKNQKNINKEMARFEKELSAISHSKINKTTFLYLKKNTTRALAKLNSKSYLKQLASKKSLSILSMNIEKNLLKLKKRGIISLRILGHD